MVDRGFIELCNLVLPAFDMAMSVSGRFYSKRRLSRRRRLRRFPAPGRIKGAA